MQTQVLVDQVVTITVEFRDFTNQGTGELVPMASVEVSIDGLNATPDYLPEIDATEVIPGVYSYEWTPTTTGEYVISFKGTTGDANITIVDEFFTVVSTLTESTVSLGRDYEYVFMAGVAPLYVDPEEIRAIYPAVDIIDAIEYIHRYSLEVEKMTGGLVPDLLAQQYVYAATLCSLSRIFDDAANPALLDEQTIVLGDLTVDRGDSDTRSSGGLNRGTARTWCELAAAYRRELLSQFTNMRSIVKGTRYTNPMPRRQLKHHYRAHDFREF